MGVMERTDRSMPRGGPLRRMAAAVWAMPIASRFGFAVLGAGLAIDVAYHVVSKSPSLAAPCCGPGFVGHVITLAGMVLVVLGVLTMAFRSRSRPPPGGRRP